MQASRELGTGERGLENPGNSRAAYFVVFGSDLGGGHVVDARHDEGEVFEVDVEVGVEGSDDDPFPG